MVKTYKDLYGSKLMVGNILGTHISLGPTFLGEKCLTNSKAELFVHVFKFVSN
jgi:hypothetical protein